VIVCLSRGGGSYSSTKGPATALVLGTVDGVYELVRSDVGWSVGGHSLPGEHVRALLHIPKEGLTFAGTEHGILISEDPGAGWKSATRGIGSEHERVLTLASQQRDESVVLWAGTQPGALYRSDDLGKTWSQNASLPRSEAGVCQIAFHPSAPQTLYACLKGDAPLHSADDGATWRRLADVPAQRVVTARDPAKLFLTAADGLHASLDGGATWHSVDMPPGHDGLDAMFLDPRDEKMLYVASDVVLRSNDGGKSWFELRNGLPEDRRGKIEAMSAHRWVKTAGLFVATSDGDVFASEERGDEWETVARGLPPVTNPACPDERSPRARRGAT
jgi:photosystem II stability/assembly factor-like uncharacterized protein